MAIAVASASCRHAPARSFSVTVYLANLPAGIARVAPARSSIVVQLDAYGFVPSARYSVRIIRGGCSDPGDRPPLSVSQITADRPGAVHTTTTAGSNGPAILSISGARGEPLTCNDLPSDAATVALTAPPDHQPGGLVTVRLIQGATVLRFDLRGLAPGSRHDVRVRNGGCTTPGGKAAGIIADLRADDLGFVDSDRKAAGLSLPPTKTVAIEIGAAGSSRAILCGEIPAATVK